MYALKLFAVFRRSSWRVLRLGARLAVLSGLRFAPFPSCPTNVPQLSRPSASDFAGPPFVFSWTRPLLHCFPFYSARIVRSLLEGSFYPEKY